jgi:heme-degrading monooxygenase HmoA
MYARMVTISIDPERMEEVVKIYRESIYPAGKEQPGHAGGLFLTDAASGKAVSISLWESEADMFGGETSDYLKEQIAKVASAFTAAPVTEHFVVSMQ